MDIDPSDLVPIGTACRILGGDESPLDQSTVYRWIKRGKISPPIKLGPGTTRFRKSVLIAERAALASAHA